MDDGSGRLDRRAALRLGGTGAVGGALAGTLGIATLVLPRAAAHASPTGPSSTTYAVGDAGPAGGVIFLTPDTVGGDGTHYYEAAPADASASTALWLRSGADTSVVVAGTGTAVGDGPANTTLMLAAGDGTVHSAGLADAYTQGGLDDWFLPSRDELQRVFDVRAQLGGIDETRRYWTSSQSVAQTTQAYAMFFSTGTFDSSFKTDTGLVRPVRRFLPPS